MTRLPRLARRKVLAVFGAAASVSWLGACALRPQQTRTPIAGLVGPLAGWRVEQVMPTVAGAIPVLMRTPEGARFQVDVMRREDETRGVAQTQSLALYLANGGAGDTRSSEAQVRGAQLLASRLAQIEAERGLPEVHGLLTLSERLASHRQAVLKPWT